MSAPEVRPVRKKRPLDAPKANQFLRGCRRCNCDFGTVEGGSTHRGIWKEMRWYCSVECFKAGEQP